MEVVVEHGVAGTAGGTKRNAVVATGTREGEGWRHLIRPAVGQALDIPLVGLDMICLARQGITLDVVDLLYPRLRSIEGDLVLILLAVLDDNGFAHDRDRVGSQGRGIEREEAGAILHEHTIHYVEAIIVHTGIVELTAVEDILLGQRTVGTTVFLIIGICPAIVESVRCLELRVDLAALHALKFTIGATECKVGITAVGGESTIVGSEARGKLLTGIGLVAEVDTYGGPLLPYDVGRGLRNRVWG